MLVYSKHAVNTMKDRDFTTYQVDFALRDPWLTTTGIAPGYGGEKTNHFGRNGVTVVTADLHGDMLVVTVLLQEDSQWDNNDARNLS